MKMRWLIVWTVPLCSLLFTAIAADWPQWRGPHRDDISQDTGLLKSWPQGGPQLLWTYSQAGSGYSGPAIVGDRLYTLAQRDGGEAVVALDVDTGKEAWSSRISSEYKNPYGDGPRCTPTVDGDRIYALAPTGDLVCLDKASGQVQWHKSLTRDLGGQLMSGWGYSESPLVDGDRVICSPGGARGTLAALDTETGKVIWRSKGITDPASYSSIVPAEVGGIKLYVQMTGKGVVGVAAKDGRLLWNMPQDTYRVAVIPTAIVHGNYVFVTAGYGAGCNLFELKADGAGGVKARKIYSSKNMENKHGGVVLVGDHIYGWTDHGSAWVCLELKTGKIVWESKKLKRGSVTFADGHLYCYSEDNGTVVLLEASPGGWKERGRFKIPEETSIRSQRGGVWTHPVVANSRLYLRDQDLIFCFDVRDRAARAGQ
jgi:outer membrane protein assembly factor BamB